MAKESSIWSFFIERPAVAYLLAIGIILAGTFATLTIPREIQPEIKIPIGIVSTSLPGANPTDVETLVTEPLEQDIANINDIKSLTSSSGLGFSSIVVEFEADADLDKAIQDLKDAVDIGKTELPEDASEPFVSKAEANEQSIISFSLVGDRPLTELNKIAEQVQEEFEALSGVSSVDIAGEQQKRIEVTILQEKAEEYGLSINQIANRIRSENYNLPVGIISTNKINYSVRIDNRLTTLEQIRNIPIFQTQDGTNILLKDIAKIEENFTEQSVISKLSIKGQESKETISLQVFKKDGANVITVADATRAKAEELKGNIIPDDVEITVSNDNSEFIRTDLGILTKSGIQTTILIIIILFLALGLVEGVLAGLSIPLTLLATVVLLQIQGLTINSLTLFSLVIALGLMVDTAIVIMEGIYENLKKGATAKEAAIISVDTYKWPLIAGTATTVFAFFPMLLVSGILGEFLKSLPLTIGAALICSIFLSLTLIPTITSRLLAKRKSSEHKTLLEPIFHKLGNFFHDFIQKIISKKSNRVMVIVLSTVLFIASMTLPIFGALKVEMFPQTDFRFFIINVETPKGLILDETVELTAEVEKELYKVPEIESFLTIIGTGQSQVATDIISVGSGGSSNRANITVNLIPKEEREKASYLVADELRKTFEKFENINVEVQEFSEGPPSDAPIALSIIGPELSKLKQISQDVQDIIGELPGTENIDDDLGEGLNEFKFVLDREIVNYHGLSGIEVAAGVRSIVQGVEATEIKVAGEDVEIVVKYDIETPNNTPSLSVQNIESFEIPSPKGYTVNLGQLGSFELVEGISSINHEDQERLVKVRSDVGPDVNVVELTTQLQEELASYELPSGYRIDFGGDTEDIEQSFQELFRSMFVAVILVGFTLVLMFNSLKQPFIILMTLPLALIGVFPGLMLVGLALSFPAFLGVVALSGVVVNDAIVLIDRINGNRKEGVELKEAIAEAANARLQPIIMTTVTTVVGILPLALTNEFWAGLGFSLVFGLLTATFLTLVVMPVLYYMFEAKADRKGTNLT